MKFVGMAWPVLRIALLMVRWIIRNTITTTIQSGQRWMSADTVTSLTITNTVTGGTDGKKIRTPVAQAFSVIVSSVNVCRNVFVHLLAIPNISKATNHMLCLSLFVPSENIRTELMPSSCSFYKLLS